jgi:hypothetical protein
MHCSLSRLHTPLLEHSLPAVSLGHAATRKEGEAVGVGVGAAVGEWGGRVGSGVGAAAVVSLLLLT